MINPYLQNLNRIEFLLTFACTGRRKHCSKGDHTPSGEYLNGDIATAMIRNAANRYKINSIMTFGGEQQRAGIARVLAHNPAILIADEPTENLDTSTENEILKIFTALAHNTPENGGGKCIIIVTHSKK